MGIKGGFSVAKTAVKDFIQDDAMQIGAALAFYAGLALAPLLIILLTATLLLSDSAQQRLVEQVNAELGPRASQVTDSIVASARERRQAGIISLIIGFGALLLSATGLFVQLQKGLNQIWEVQARPGQGVMGWLRKRLMGLVVIGIIGLLLLASMVLTAVLGAVLGNAGWVWQAVNIVVATLLSALLFAAIFKWLPDVNIPWREALWGGAVTAVLFNVGKWGIGLYLSRSSVGSVYGAAGSLLVVLVWIYYSSLIFFFGAEVTQALARRLGSEIVPDKYAQWDPKARRRGGKDQPRRAA